MKIGYFAGGTYCPLILLYGNHPNDAYILSVAVERLANGSVDQLAIHELPGFISVNGCKLFGRVGRWDMGIYPFAEEPAFEGTIHGMIIANRGITSGTQACGQSHG